MRLQTHSPFASQPRSSFQRTILPNPSRRATSPGNSFTSDLLLRDISSLLLTSELISSSLIALRPECAFSPELTSSLNSMIALCDEGESRIQESRMEANLVWPATTDNSASTLITGFFTRLPSADDPQSFATELIINLQLLAQHVGLKARIAGEEATIIGFERLGHELAEWSRTWSTCGENLGNAMFRNRVHTSAAPFPKDILASTRGT